MERILIVDDVKMNRVIFRELFRDEYEITEAENGERAFQILVEEKIEVDLIVTDLEMPTLNGHQLLERLKQHEELKKIPVVLMSTSEEMDDQIKAFELGAEDYIAKPFMPEVVRYRIQNVIMAHKRMGEILLDKQQWLEKAELDLLTGIYNKMTAQRLIEYNLKESAQKKCALLVFDVDNFKSINDQLGHLAGDGVLQHLAKLLQTQFRSEDVIGRIGGDEFIAYMSDVSSCEAAETKANDLLRLLHFRKDMHQVTITIGLAYCEDETVDFEALFERADTALYEAKKEGKNRCVVFGRRQEAAKEIIREQEFSIEYLLDNMEEMVIISDKSTKKLLYMNRAAIEILQWNQDYVGIFYGKVIDILKEEYPMFEENYCYDRVKCAKFYEKRLECMFTTKRKRIKYESKDAIIEFMKKI